jgi:uncharacterized membrane protein/protein-disulfide isomerase
MVELGKNSGQAVPMRSAARRWLLIFAILGLVTSGTSTYVHYQLLQDRTYTSFCDVSSTVSCTQAYLSPYGSFAGVPVALLGLLWFVLATILASLTLKSPAVRLRADGAAAGRAPAGRRPNPAEADVRDSAAGYLFVWSTIGLAVILYLAYAAFVILKEVCLLCVGSYVAVVGLFVISGIVMDYPMTTLPNRLGRDVRRLLTSPAALAVALVFAAGAATAIAFFPKDASSTAVSQAQPPSSSSTQAQQPGQPQSEFERWYFSQPIVDAGVAMEGAKVLIVKFNDYLCPACGQSYRDYKAVLAKYEASNPGAVRLVTKDYPLDQECNFNITNGPHQAACEAAAAVRMAEANGKKEAMAEWLYSNQTSATPESVKQAAATVGGVTDFDAQYPRVLQAIKADVAAGGAVNVRSTPTFIINGRLISGALPVQFFDQAIALELKRAGVK